MGAPYQALAAKDGYFIIGANNARLWKRLGEALDRPDLPADPRFATVADRLANRPALVAELESFFATRTVEESVDLLLKAGIPAGPILNYAQSLGSAHALARGIVMDIDHPIEGKVKSIGFPVKLSGTPQTVSRHPPLLGEHTAEVLAELGIDARQRSTLRRQGAFEA
jgi:formyl-CoA transferase